MTDCCKQAIIIVKQCEMACKSAHLSEIKRMKKKIQKISSNNEPRNTTNSPHSTQQTISFTFATSIMDLASVVHAGANSAAAVSRAMAEHKKNKMEDALDRLREGFEYREVDQVKAEFAVKDAKAARKAEDKFISARGLKLTQEERTDLLRQFAETKHLAFVGMGGNPESVSELDKKVVDTLRELDPITLSAVGRDSVSVQRPPSPSSPNQYQHQTPSGGKRPKTTVPPITPGEHYEKMKTATREHADIVHRALEDLGLEVEDGRGLSADLGLFKARKSFTATRIKTDLCAKMAPKKGFRENDMDEIATRLSSAVQALDKRSPSESPVFGLLVNKLRDEYIVWVIGLYVAHDLHLRMRYKSVTARYKSDDSGFTALS